jgi:hypothetical protein
MNYALLSCALFSVLSISAADAPRSIKSFKSFLVAPRGGVGKKIHPEEAPVAGTIYSITSTINSEVVEWRGSLFEDGTEGPEHYVFFVYKDKGLIPSGYWSLRKTDVGFTSECTHYLRTAN